MASTPSAILTFQWKPVYYSVSLMFNLITMITIFTKVSTAHKVSGWVIESGSGEVFAYDPEQDEFLKIGD